MKKNKALLYLLLLTSAFQGGFSLLADCVGGCGTPDSECTTKACCVDCKKLSGCRKCNKMDEEKMCCSTKKCWAGDKKRGRNGKRTKKGKKGRRVKSKKKSNKKRGRKKKESSGDE